LLKPDFDPNFFKFALTIIPWRAHCRYNKNQLIKPDEVRTIRPAIRVETKESKYGGN
jgi:hypothetical protein